MKKTIPCVAFLTLFINLNNAANSQINVVSANGYVVNIVITPRSVVPASNNCQYGYNYNINLDYSVTFTGTNIPANLYTLQGTVGCGSSKHFFSVPTHGGNGNLTTNSNVWRAVSDCATATLSSLSCNTISLTINGPGISNRTIDFTPQNGALPVSITNFSADAMKGKVKLQWSTATETNNDYFSVERSANGIAWTEIKRINGAGNSVSLLNYTYYDEYPVAGNSYYRLRQTDLDGKSTYTATRSVIYTGGDNISLYPVPNSGNTVSFRGISDPASIMMVVRDAAGSSVYTTMLSTNDVQLPALKGGMYFISLTNKTTGEITNLRYIKL